MHASMMQNFWVTDEQGDSRSWISRIEMQRKQQCQKCQNVSISGPSCINHKSDAMPRSCDQNHFQILRRVLKSRRASYLNLACFCWKFLRQKENKVIFQFIFPQHTTPQTGNNDQALPKVLCWCHSGLILILAALQSPPTPQNWSATVCLGYEISMELGAEKIYGY